MSVAPDLLYVIKTGCCSKLPSNFYVAPETAHKYVLQKKEVIINPFPLTKNYSSVNIVICPSFPTTSNLTGIINSPL